MKTVCYILLTGLALIVLSGFLGIITALIFIFWGQQS